jgi:ferredoxin
MAEVAEKWPDNSPGRFYVDEQCIDCDLCRELAPEFFRRNDGQGYSYVYHQPSTDEERGECEEALESCPVEAIGNDGGESS